MKYGTAMPDVPLHPKRKLSECQRQILPVMIGGEKCFHIPLNHGKYAIVNAEDLPKVLDTTWMVSMGRYAINTKRVLMHRLILGTPNGSETDHVNRNGLDNRRCNLRIASTSQNMANQVKHGNYTSKYKGVCFSPERKGWLAHIGFQGKVYGLGKFMSEKKAALAYDKAAKKYFKEFACTNF